jgi:hypothetical protein
MARGIVRQGARDLFILERDLFKMARDRIGWFRVQRGIIGAPYSVQCHPPRGGRVDLR